MRRRWLAIVAAATVAAGCTAEGAQPVTTESTGAASVPTRAADVSAPDAATAVPLTSSESSGNALTPGPGSPIVVDGGFLPRAVIDAVGRHGGELADQSVWDARFETFGLPRVVGVGVVLIEASIDATRMTNGWRRIDELQWLLQDTSSDGIGSLLDKAASAAGEAGWPVVETMEVVDGAACTKRVYSEPSVPTSPNWTLQGCSFPTLPGMYSLGVSRDGVFTGAEVPMVEPTVDQVAGALAGTVDEVHVEFGHPEATGSVTTLRISVQLSFNSDLGAAVAALGDGPLSGWQQFPGDASVMLSGTGGASWVLSDGSARFSFEGRLQS